MLNRKHILFLLLIFFAVAVPRLIDLDQVVTVDEYYWVRRSANIYYNIFHPDPAATYQIYHPGVPTQYLGGLSVQFSFPEYRVIAPGQLDDMKYEPFHQLVKDAGKSELAILTTGRQAIVFAVAGLMLLCYLAARQLVGDLPALGGGLLVALDPYYMGHSRLLQVEGIFSLLLLVSVLLLVIYLREQKTAYLLAAAATAGLACLSKSPGIIMFPYMGLVLLAAVYTQWRQQKGENLIRWWRVSWQQLLKPLLMALLVLVLVYVLLWPAMWVKPLEVMDNVYGRSLRYVGVGSAEGIEEGFMLEEGLGYIQSLLWRTTPVTWLAALLTLAWLIIHRQPSARRQSIFWLVVFAAAFLAMMALSSGGGKRAPHYILSVHVALNMAAGIGAAALVQKLRPRLLLPVVLVLAVLQFWSGSSQAPYYFTYYNPLVGTAVEGADKVGVGYGEVLEQAAQYLSAKTDAENTTVLSWTGYGPFSYFYPGPVINLPHGKSWGKPKIKWLSESDYLVMYYAQQVRRQQPATLVETLRDVAPEHSIWYNGIEYVRIYRTNELPESLYTPDP